MTTEPLGEPAMRERLARLRASLEDESGTRRPPAAMPRARTGRGPVPRTRPDERPAHPGHREQLRRDRHRARRGRPADPQPTSSRARSRCTPPPAGSCPRSPRGRTCAGSCRSWIAAMADAGAAWPDIDAVAVTHGPGPGRLAARRHQLREGARVGPRQAARRGQPPRGPRLRGVAAPTGATEPRGTEFPLVALVVSGGHTFLVEMTDHLTYRLLGQTVDDAAGEAFDKVGRLLGLGYPGGPAIMKAAAGATRRDVVFPRAWLGDTYDFSFSGLKTAARRIVDAARADEGLPADDPDARLSDAHGRRARVRVPGVGRGRARHEDDAGRRGDGRAVDRAGRRRRREQRRCASAWRPRPSARPPAHRPAGPALCTDNGAMIGAAGARRFAAGERAGLDLDARPSLPLARAMSEPEPGRVRHARRGAAPPRRRRGAPDAQGSRAAGPPLALAELPRRHRRARGDPGRGRADRPGGGSSRSGPASGS